jgi:hypothetical protein
MRILLYMSSILLVILTVLACDSAAPETSGPHNIIERNCMSRIIVFDDSLGRIRNHASEKIDLSTTIKQYLKSCRAMNYKNCPLAFNAAIEKHYAAWEKMLPLTNKYPDLRGEMTQLFKQLKTREHAQEFIPLEKAIIDTWVDIDAVLERRN